MAGFERISNDWPLLHRVATRGGPALLLFALPFVGTGVFVALIGLGAVTVDPASVHAPMPVITAVGAAFGLAGVAVAAQGMRATLHAARRRRRELLTGGEAWRVDWPFDANGAVDSPWRHALLGWAFAGFLSLFLSPFVWWGFLSGHGPFLVKLVVGMFASIGVLSIVAALRRTVQALRYGRSYLIYERVPFRLGDELRVRFGPCRFDRLDVALECLLERCETTGTGNNRSNTLVSYRLFADERTLDLAPNTPEVELRLPLPDDPELTTDFSSEAIRYWRVRLRGEAPGIDLTTAMPVPVYADTARASRVTRARSERPHVGDEAAVP